MERFTAVELPRTVRTRRRRMLARRLVSLPLALFGFPLMMLLAPLVFPVVLLIDVVVARRRFPTTRLFLAVGGYAFWTLVTQVVVAGVWVASGFGLRNWHGPTQHRWRRLTRWWVRVNTRWFQLVCGYDIEVEGLQGLHGGPLLVFARHESIFDAFLPPLLITRADHMWIRVVLMRELRYEPSLDMVGHRAPHHFVERVGRDQQAEIDAVGRLASGLDDASAVVIFPEGRLARPEVRRRVIERLEATDPEAAARARQLNHLLPPRNGGALALLAAAPPGTDVALVGHVGFSALTDPRTVWRSIPLRHPIEVVVRRCSSEDIPIDEDERSAWLYRNWRELDAWVGERLAARTP